MEPFPSPPPPPPPPAGGNVVVTFDDGVLTVDPFVITVDDNDGELVSIAGTEVQFSFTVPAAPGNVWVITTPSGFTFASGGVLVAPFTGVVGGTLLMAEAVPAPEEPPQAFFERRRKKRERKSDSPADRPDP